MLSVDKYQKVKTASRCLVGLKVSIVVHSYFIQRFYGAFIALLSFSAASDWLQGNVIRS